MKATNDATLMIEPLPDDTSAGSAARAKSHTPRTLTAMVSSHTSTGVSSGPSSSAWLMPALL